MFRCEDSVTLVTACHLTGLTEHHTTYYVAALVRPDGYVELSTAGFACPFVQFGDTRGSCERARRGVCQFGTRKAALEALLELTEKILAERGVTVTTGRCGVTFQDDRPISRWSNLC